MPLANFPVKPQTPTRATEFKLPLPLAKREHRGARVYQPKSPTVRKPKSAHIYDRPAPILELPGLPSSPVTLDLPKDDPSNFASKFIKTSKDWFEQIKVPFVKESPLTPKIPPTPKTPDWRTELLAKESPTPSYSATKFVKFASLQKKPAIRHKRTPPAVPPEWTKDPPPLYSKHPEEGGRRAWMSVVGAFIVQFCTIGYLLTWNVFEDFYAHHFLSDQNPIAIRFIGSLQWFLAFFLAVVGGKLSDYGYFAHTVIGGSILFISCLFLLSIAPEESIGLILVCQGIGTGISTGLLFVPTATIVTRYFSQKRGLAVGIAMSGGPFGGLILTTILRDFTRGFGPSVRITAFLIAPLLVIGFLLMRNPPVEPKPTFPVPRLDIHKYSKERDFIAIAGATFLGLLFVSYPAFYLELIGLDHEVQSKVARIAVVVASLTGIIGSVLFGFASDKVGVWNMLLIDNAVLAIFMFGMGGIRNKASLIAFAFFYGFFFASWFSLTVTALSSFVTRTQEMGTRVGLVMSIGSFACLFSALIQNAVLGNAKWGRVSALAGVVFLLVVGLTAFSRMRRAVKSRKRKFLVGMEYLQIV